MKILICVFLVTILISCSFEYESTLLTAEEKRSTPDMVLTNLSERVYDNGEKILELTSSFVQVFETQRIQKIEGLSFIRFEDDGKQSVAGKADSASRNLDNDDILLSGNVNLYIEENNYQISGEEFLFSPDQELIWTPDDVLVLLKKEDNIRVQGMGFIADLLLQEFRFENGATGFIEDEEQEQ